MHLWTSFPYRRETKSQSRARIYRGNSWGPGHGENLRGQGTVTPGMRDGPIGSFLGRRQCRVSSSPAGATGTPQLPRFSFIGHDVCSNPESYYLLRKQNVHCCCLYNTPLTSVSTLFRDIDHPVACTSATLLTCLVISHYGISVCLISGHSLPLGVFQKW